MKLGLAPASEIWRFGIGVHYEGAGCHNGLNQKMVTKWVFAHPPYLDLNKISHVGLPPGRVSLIWVSERLVNKFRSCGRSKFAFSHWQGSSLKSDTHRRHRRDSTVELSRVEAPWTHPSSVGSPHTHYTVWVRKKSPLRTCGNISKTAGNFSTKFYTPIMHSYLR